MIVADDFILAEYASIVQAATREGWLLPLLEAHCTPCERDDAERLLAWIRVYQIEGGLPGNLDMRWRNRRGRARFNKRTGQYGISLPSDPGTSYGRLRAGLVLHEAAHVIDRIQSGTFGHKEKYRRILRRLVESNWRKNNVRIGNQREIYERHRGPYSLLLGRAVPGKGGKIQHETDRVRGPFNAEEAHEEARMLVNDPRDNVTDIHVFSDSEGQFTGAFYKRGVDYTTWTDMLAADLAAADPKEQTDEGGLEPRPDEQPLTGPAEAALLSGSSEPVRQVDAPDDGGLQGEPAHKPRPVRNVPPKEQAAAGTQRKRGAVLELDPGSAERWPASKGASIVRTALEGGLRGTATELAKAVAADLTAAGVEFPASLISRLKQGGFIREAA